METNPILTCLYWSAAKTVTTFRCHIHTKSKKSRILFVTFLFGILGLKMKKSGVVAPIIELWYSYNIQGRLTQVKRDSTVITEYIYDTNGQKIQKKMPVAGLDVLYGNLVSAIKRWNRDLCLISAYDCQIIFYG